MSIVRKLVLGNRDLRPHKTDGDCEYQVVESTDGARYLQLSTFGSDHRKDKGTVSQAIQFDADRARELAAIILKSF